MNAVFEQRMSKAEFFRWVQGREGRYELSEGRVMQQTGGTVRHFDLADAIAFVLKSKVDRARWGVTVGGPGVAVPEPVATVTTRYPDVVARSLGASPTALEIDNPVVLFEVLSPLSVTLDLVIKPREYKPIRSLVTYIVASQDEPRLTIWQRNASGVFDALPIELTDPRTEVRLDGLGSAVTIEELYRGVLPV